MVVAARKKKRSIEEVRRHELIEAAYNVFMETGLKGLTTTRICNEAGLSQGILTYYFKDKDEVLFAMVRMANRILMDGVVQGLKRAETPWDRLMAIIEGNFPADRYDGNTANAWVSFYAETGQNKRFHRLQELFYRRLNSNLASALSPHLSREDLRRFSYGFAALLDGLWMRRGHGEGAVDVEEAKAVLRGYAHNMLGDDLVALLKRK